MDALRDKIAFDGPVHRPLGQNRIVKAEPDERRQKRADQKVRNFFE
jgi:hypothetical protein